MVLFYVSKIRNEEINAQTNKIWAIEDVPTLWKAKVKAELEK